MAIKTLSKSKRLSRHLSQRKTNRKTKTTKHNQNKVHKNKHKTYNKNKNNNHNHNHIYRSFSKSKKYSKKYSKKIKYLKGGFINDPSCNLATIKEPGFNLSNLSYGSGSSSIGGLNISDSRAIIYNPNCKSDSYQAMIP